MSSNRIELPRTSNSSRASHRSASLTTRAARPLPPIATIMMARLTAVCWRGIITRSILLLAMAASISISSFRQVDSAPAHYQTYEAILRQVDNGNKVTSEKIYLKLNSADLSQAKPPLLTDDIMTNSIADGHHLKVSMQDAAIWPHIVKPNKIKLRRPSNDKLHKYNLINGPDNEAGSLNSIDGHQSSLVAPIRPRTVESPALSVDTGRGRSSNPSVRLANGIKRLFNVEEGHYTDIYERIDKHKSLNKRKPSADSDSDQSSSYSYGHKHVSKSVSI